MEKKVDGSKRKDQHVTVLVKFVSSKLPQNPVLHALSIVGIIGGVSVCGVLLRNAYIKRNHALKKSPPGLLGIPYFGSLITAIYHKGNFMSKVVPSFGPIMRYSMGSLEFIIISDHKLLQEIFKSKYAVDRPQMFENMIPETAKMDIPFSQINSNKFWAERRKFMMASMNAISDRDYVQRQVNFVLNKWTYNAIELNMNGWKPRQDVRHAVFNIMFGAIFGEEKQLSKTDSTFIDFNTKIKESFEADGLFLLNILFPYNPIIKLIQYFSNKQMKKRWHEIGNLTQKHIDIAEIEYKKKLLNNDTLNKNYFDEFYSKISNNKNIIITPQMFNSDIFLLLLGSMDTTGNTIEFGLVLAAKYLNIQEKIYNELIKYGNPTKNNETNKFQFDLKKINQCVQFKAFIHETLRISSIGILSEIRDLPQDCRLRYNLDQNGVCQDIEIKGLNEINTKEESDNKFEFEYIIPKNMWVHGNLAYINRRNKQLWNKGNDPTDLNLDYWLINDNGKLKFNNNKNSMPFGFGLRDCPGQTLAKKELYGFLANLFLNYKFMGPNKEENFELKFDDTILSVINPEVALTVEKRPNYNSC